MHFLARQPHHAFDNFSPLAGARLYPRRQSCRDILIVPWASPTGTKHQSGFLAIPLVLVFYFFLIPSLNVAHFVFSWGSELRRLFLQLMLPGLTLLEQTRYFATVLLVPSSVFNTIPNQPGIFGNVSDLASSSSLQVVVPVCRHV